MIFELWVILVIVSLILVTIGLIKPDQTAQSIIGFFFLFLLAMPVLSGSIETDAGANVTTAFIYDGNGSIVSSAQSLEYNYTNWSDSVSHNIGFWMAIGSSIGFFGVLFSLDKVRYKFKQWTGYD